MKNSDTLLLVIPSVVSVDQRGLRVEEDFLKNLGVYCRNFGKVVFACPALTPEQNDGYIQRSTPITDLPVNAHYVRLPYTYREDSHLRHYGKTKKLLSRLIDSADYLLIAPHAPFDWPTVAGREAVKRGRKYDMEYAVDYNELMRVKVSSMPRGLKRIRTAIYSAWMKREAYRLFSRSSLALLQGDDLFEAYKGAAPNPHTMLNVQVREEDLIAPVQLEQKLVEVQSGAPLKIMYAGRMTERKGALDWIRAIKSSKCEALATWFGDGPEHNQMLRMADGTAISLPGLVPREQLLRSLREAHIFLFCHKVPESPRCLIEALASGAPLVGYRSPYPEGLTASGGGEFVEVGDWQALGSKIAELNRDRPRLADLIRGAVRAGSAFDHDRAVQRRVDLIRKFAGRPIPHQSEMQTKLVDVKG